MAKTRQDKAMAALERAAGGPLTIGRALWAIRECDEISQAVFAKRLGISAQHLCDIEKGRRAPRAARAAKWAKVLGYSPEQFAELALQAELDAAGLKLRARVKAA
ncbi:MAG TPA: helix-turn-helix transcriptional regulator [Steroidobacteraceae bacterium]|jgi:transcriptional regulator with XRE-family HTH domain|nr:helix-turn-helix transcriptional regulator [Steroidobacteraceae bacterium]